jgi:hypothetical protein
MNHSTMHYIDRIRAENALHFARKHEQRVWGSGGDHEKARAEVERLEAILATDDAYESPSLITP